MTVPVVTTGVSTTLMPSLPQVSLLKVAMLAAASPMITTIVPENL